MSYNGHKCWSYWNVSLWLANDEALYRLVCDVVRRTRTLDKATDRLLEILPATTPDGARYTKSAVRAALCDWR